MTAPDLDDLARRPQRYWNVDGLPELMMGVLWMLWGGAWPLGMSLPHDWRFGLYWLITPTLLVLSGFAAVWAVKAVKARLTFPRTGYVDWDRPGRAARWGTAMVAIVGGLILAIGILLMKSGGRPEQMAMPITTVILSLAFVVASIRQRAPHYLALAAVAVALAIALGRMRTGWESLAWLFVFLGLATAAIGAVRLALFLRRHPRVPGEGA